MSTFGAPRQSALPVTMLVLTPRSVEFFRHNGGSEFEDGLHAPPAYCRSVTGQLQFAHLHGPRTGRGDVHRAGLDARLRVRTGYTGRGEPVVRPQTLAYAGGQCS